MVVMVLGKERLAVPDFTISTPMLTLEQVPPIDAAWDEISRFALTYDLDQCEDVAAVAVELPEVDSDTGLESLRFVLYSHQRAWNHLGTDPPPELLGKLRDVVDLIRAKLALS